MEEDPYRNRMRRRETSGDIRFITFSCYQRLPLLRNPAISDFVQDVLAEQRALGHFQLFAWVIMPEHMHVLVRLKPGIAWAPVATSFKTSTARTILSRWRKLQAPVLEKLAASSGRARFWQHGGGFDRNARDLTEVTKFVRYIHLNPVERGLVKLPEQWRWSSVRWWMGERDGEVECDRLPGAMLDWENWKGHM